MDSLKRMTNIDHRSDEEVSRINVAKDADDIDRKKEKWHTRIAKIIYETMKKRKVEAKIEN